MNDELDSISSRELGVIHPPVEASGYETNPISGWVLRVENNETNPISASESEGVPKSESVIIAEVKLSCPGVSQCRQLRKVWVDERSISRDHQTKPVVSCDDCVGDTLGRRGKAEG